MAGVSITKDSKDSDDDDYGYYSSSGFSLHDNRGKEDLKFDLPNLSYPQLLTLLDFLKFPREKYIANNPIILDSTFVFEKLLPDFKKYFEEVKANKPALLAKYIVESKPILESSANRTLREYTDEVKRLILDKSTTEPSKPLEALLDKLLLLNKKVSILETSPILYKSIMRSTQEIADFKALPEVSQNPELVKLLDRILDGIELFAKYNRCESVLANQSFFKDIEDFLNKKKITRSLCKIVEDTLLLLTGAKLGANGEAHLDKGSDPSRLVFSFTDMDKESSAKIVDFLQKAGDDTANEGYGYRRYGSSLPHLQGALASASFLQSDISSKRVELERHSIETDGKFFFEVVFPKLTAAIEKMDAIGLEFYCKKSEVYFAKKEVTPKNNGLFKQPPVICPVSPSEFEIDADLAMSFDA